MTPEQKQPAPIPSLKDVNAAYADIVEHNSKHASMGAGLANLFMGLARSSEIIDYGEPGDSELAEVSHGEDPQKLDEHIEQAVTEGDMHGELQGILHEDTFVRIGVGVAPLGSHMVNGLGERTTSTSLVARIANTELYKDFLATLKPADVEAGKDQRLLQALLGNLQNTVSRCFDPAEREKIPEEMQGIVTAAGEDALRTFIAIAPEYERLELDAEALRAKFPEKPAGTGYIMLSEDAPQQQKDEQAAHNAYNQASEAANTFETMETYVAYWGRNLLPEFIVADRWQYATDPEDQRFGPAAWHTDGYQRQWRHALEFLAGLEQDESKKAFGEEVRQNLTRSLDAAIGEIDDDKKEVPAYVAEQRDDLDNIRNALNGQPFDQKRFEEYTKEPDYSS